MISIEYQARILTYRGQDHVYACKQGYGDYSTSLSMILSVYANRGADYHL